MENKKYISKLKFNVFDVFIVLLVLALLAMLAYRIYVGFSEDRAVSGEAEYIVTFKSEDNYKSIANYVSEGERVYSSLTGELLGYIYIENQEVKVGLLEVTANEETNLEETSTEETTTQPQTEENTEAEIEPSDYDKVDFAGQLKLSGNVKASSEGNYYVLGDQNITVGGTMKVYTEKTEFTIVIEKIELLG